MRRELVFGAEPGGGVRNPSPTQFASDQLCIYLGCYPSTGGNLEGHFATLAGLLGAHTAGMGTRQAAEAARLLAAGAGRRGDDLDLAAPPPHARELAESLARTLASKVLPLGREWKRVFRIPRGGGEIDIWETTGSAREDLLRRDFTVNALAVRLPSFALETVPGALDDLASGSLRPPRSGVFREDPIRVLRAARFEAELPGFRLVRQALPELREVVSLLPSTPAERRLAEMDRVLGASPALRNRALNRLEAWGVLAALLPGTAPNERRAGLRLLGRLAKDEPALARALLLAPVEALRADEILEEWKVPKRDRRLAARLRTVPLPDTGRPPTRRELAVFFRASAPFITESIAYARALGSPGSDAIAAAAARICRHPGALKAILNPARPAQVEEISSWLGGVKGAGLGAVLAALDIALASGEVRGKKGAREFVAGLARPPA